jgi:SAM-dependent methyltransferase
VKETAQFYNDLARYFHLIFKDWDASMARQGDLLERLIRTGLAQSEPMSARILDAACGIGTQTLPLAARGFQVVARDLSPAAIARLRQEAETRGLMVDAAVADMRQVTSTVSGWFDVVLAFDNSLAHLLTDDDLSIAFREFLSALRPSGLFLCSVRDYDKVKRGEPSIHSYGARQQHGEKFQLKQEWIWHDPMHYQATLIIDRETPIGLAREFSSASEFYAVSTSRLLELMRDAGFKHCNRIDEVMYQPILTGMKTA